MAKTVYFTEQYIIMSLSLIEGALGGIGLFLLGMRLMSEGIRTVANTRIRNIFTSLTSNRFYSILSGLLLSLAVNSGSAAVVFSIGLVNGGVISTFQALNVIAGILLGASLSLHISVIPYNLISTPLIFTGVLLKFFARRRSYANAGDLLLGIGLLFLGLTLLKGSYKPFESHPFYTAFNGVFFHNPLLSTLFGGLVSFLVQSARSSVEVIESLSISYQINPVTAIRMIEGGFIGLAAMGSLAALGGNSVTRRVANSYLLFSIAVTILLVPLSPVLLQLAKFIALNFNSTAYPENSLFTALSTVHTVASCLVAAVLVVISAPLALKLGVMDDSQSEYGSATTQPRAGYIDDRILNTPRLAIEQVRKEIVRMMSVTNYMYADVHEILFDFDARRAETVRQHERVLDSLNYEITHFLAELTQVSNSPEISYEIPRLFQTVTDLEHIGDHCEDILDCIITRKDSGVIFSDDAMEDIKSIADTISKVISGTERVIRGVALAEEFDLRTSKKMIRNLFDEIRKNHFERISDSSCPPKGAKLFNEILSNFEAIASFCWNIAQSYGRKPL